jgi:hypothetical protein
VWRPKAIDEDDVRVHFFLSWSTFMLKVFWLNVGIGNRPQLLFTC